MKEPFEVIALSSHVRRRDLRDLLGAALGVLGAALGVLGGYNQQFHDRLTHDQGQVRRSWEVAGRGQPVVRMTDSSLI